MSLIFFFFLGIFITFQLSQDFFKVRDEHKSITCYLLLLGEGMKLAF